MVKIAATYIGDGRVELVHGPSGEKIITDLPTDNGGQARSFSPTDLAAASIASCILSIMSLLAKSNKIDLTGASIEIEKHMIENPRRIDKFIGVIKLPPDLKAQQKEKLLSCVKACPVSRSLHPDVKVEFSVD